jgi:NADH-quinone oxidoreductase subunit L
MLEFVWLVPILPLLGAVINAFLGYRLGRRVVGIVACGVVGLAFVVGVLVTLGLTALPPDERLFVQPLFTWVAAGDFAVRWALQVDPLSAVMILIVTGVGFLIHVYSVGYMADDPSYARFFTYLNLFVASMLVLVLADNFLMLYVGWELVGLCSYLLISFWYTRQTAADAAKKAFIVNRVGDFGFALGVMLIFVTFGSLDYARVFEAAPIVLAAGGTVATAITLLLFIGATGKSAQLPLYVWLPDAMEGPTPVSALIHAATMVTAGVYMVARTHVLFELAPLSQTVVAVVGTVTALYAATIALVQPDIKRVLAYSTISQIGYMMLGVGVGAYAAGIFHLMTHAFFKALLFLAAGSVMHGLAGETNMFKMGGLYARMRTTALTFIFGWLAIAGIPPFSGFFSKDEILAETFHRGQPGMWLLGVITVALTAFYVGRQVFLVFFGQPRDEHLAQHAHESPPVMTVPLITLAVLSLVGGFVGLPAAGGSAFARFLEPVFAGERGAMSGGFDTGLAAISVAAGLIGIAAAYTLYVRGAPSPAELARRFASAYRTLLNKYYVDGLYDTLFVRPFVGAGTWLWQNFDLGVIDGAVNGVGQAALRAGARLRTVQTGYVRNYALVMLMGVVVVVAWFVSR